MKRTTEKILLLLGIIINIIVSIYSFINLDSINNSDTKKQLSDALSSSTESSITVDQVISQLQTVMITLGSLGIISIIIGFIAFLLLKKKRKISAILLIIGSIISINPAVFILWVIVAIMLFVRKEKNSLDDNWDF